ncbi:MAG TPA: RNA 2',3'-cyclic phosphodiesterase [Coleofasciculaceae cyanobacterium]|jgi:2'-5' RNA ligase
MPEKRRLFIASPLAGPLRENLLAVYERRELITAQIPRRIRWVPPEQWHLTWLFLGDVDAGMIPEVQERLASALSNFQPVHAELDDLTLWPNARRANVLICRLKHEPSLASLSEMIRMALPEFKADKPFAPHITLARLKEARPGVQTRFHPEGFQATEGMLDSVVLYQSTLTAEGAIHQPLWTLSPAN